MEEQSIAMAVFTSIVQGILVAGLSTYPTLPLYRKRISQKCRIHQHFWKICFKII